MSDRIVIALIQAGDQLMCYLDDVGNVDSTPFLPVPSEDVRLQGQSILASLRTNRQINAAFTALNPHAVDPCPIYFCIRSDPADRIAWETLCDGHFYALDCRWPIVRVAARSRPMQRYVDSPLRILAVMGAVGCSAAGQWKHLYQALLQSRLTNAWELHGLLCEPALLRQPDPPDARIHAELLVSRQQLLSEIERVSPHIVHFFCHGTPGDDAQAPTLFFATRNDFDGEIEPGSIQITAAALGSCQALTQYTCLLTLNSCFGADSTLGLASLARTLVEQQVPAVVGMRFRISPAQADTFCESYYPGVLAAVAAFQQGPVNAAELNWDYTLSAARQAIDANGGNNGAWSNPILYVGSNPLQVRASVLASRDATAARAKQQELAKLKEFRNTLGSSLPPAVFAQLEERIQQVGRELCQ